MKCRTAAEGTNGQEGAARLGGGDQTKVKGRALHLAPGCENEANVIPQLYYKFREK